MDSPTNAKQILISLSALRVLLFGDETLEGIKPSSKGLGDTAKVLIIPFPLGKALGMIDPEEEFFHVELFEEPPTAHAEVWLSFEWKESNTRRSRQVVRAQEERVFRHKNESRLKELADHFRNLGYSQPGFAEHLASTVLANYKKGDYSATLKILNILDKLERFEQEDYDNGTEKST